MRTLISNIHISTIANPIGLKFYIWMLLLITFQSPFESLDSEIWSKGSHKLVYYFCLQKWQFRRLNLMSCNFLDTARNLYYDQFPEGSCTLLSNDVALALIWPCCQKWLLLQFRFLFLSTLHIIIALTPHLMYPKCKIDSPATN